MINNNRKEVHAMEIKEAFSEFILDRKIRGLSDKSIADYTEFITPFIRFMGGDLSVGSISQERINGYILSLYNRKLAKASVATHIRNIKIFLRWIQERESVRYNVDKIPMPHVNKKFVHIYSNKEVRLIFETIKAESDWMTARNRAAIALMLDSGLRQAEVCGTRKEDYDAGEHTLTIIGKGEKQRIVPIGKLSEAFIQDYMSLCPFTDTKHLFVDRRGKPMTGNALKLLMQKLSTKLPFSLSCHKLRHNFGTNYCLDMYKKNGRMDPYSLQILMGHSDMKTTKRYIHHAESIVAVHANLSHLDIVYTEELTSE